MNHDKGINTGRTQQQINSLGLAGFIVSLVGLASCGLLAPIGLVMSLMAVGRQPRGFAVAGIILGALGSMWAVGLLLVTMIIGVGALAVAAAATGILGPQFEMGIDSALIDSGLEDYQRAQGRLPDSLDALPDLLDEARRDPWGRPYRYQLSEDGTRYELWTDGPDGLSGTADDRKLD